MSSLFEDPPAGFGELLVMKQGGSMGRHTRHFDRVTPDTWSSRQSSSPLKTEAQGMHRSYDIGC